MSNYLQLQPEGYRCILCETKYMGAAEASSHLLRCEPRWQFEQTGNYTILIGQIKDVGTLQTWAVPPICCWMTKTQISPAELHYSGCPYSAQYRLRLFGGQIIAAFDRLCCEQHKPDILNDYRKCVEQNQLVENYLQQNGFRSINEAASKLKLDNPGERRKIELH